MESRYSLRLYDTELMRIVMEKRGMAGLVEGIVSSNEAPARPLALDREGRGEGTLSWPELWGKPQDSAFEERDPQNRGLRHPE